jgi:hypothetical protein
MSQTDDCVIQFHGQKMSTIFFFKVFYMLLQYKLGGLLFKHFLLFVIYVFQSYLMPDFSDLFPIAGYTTRKIPLMYSFSGNSSASAPISTFMCL